MEKLVTIATSVYQPKFFDEFVQDTMSQTIFKDCQWEIFEVGVEDKSYKKTLPDNVRYRTTQSRLSVYDVWNEIAKDTKTPYLANYNVDDRSAVNHLETLVGALEIYDDVGMVYCPNLETSVENETFLNNSSNNKGFPCHSFDPNHYWKNNSAHARPCWRKSLHDKHGYFDTNYRICADYEFWLRCISKGEKFYKVCVSPLYLYHRNKEGVSSAQENLKEAFKEIEQIKRTYGYIT